MANLVGLRLSSVRLLLLVSQLGSWLHNILHYRLLSNRVDITDARVGNRQTGVQ